MRKHGFRFVPLKYLVFENVEICMMFIYGSKMQQSVLLCYFIFCYSLYKSDSDCYLLLQFFQLMTGIHAEISDVFSSSSSRCTNRLVVTASVRLCFVSKTKPELHVVVFWYFMDIPCPTIWRFVLKNIWLTLWIRLQFCKWRKDFIAILSNS